MEILALGVAVVALIIAFDKRQGPPGPPGPQGFVGPMGLTGPPGPGYAEGDHK